MTVVDASVFVSGFVAAEAQHETSRRWLQRQTERRDHVRVPVLALAEIAGALSRRTGVAGAARLALDWVGALPGLTLVEIDEDLGRLAAELAASLRLRGADAVYVAIASVLGDRLVTWDTEVVLRAAPAVDVGFPEV